MPRVCNSVPIVRGDTKGPVGASVDGDVAEAATPKEDVRQRIPDARRSIESADCRTLRPASCMVREAMPKETQRMNPRAQVLADILEKGARALDDFAGTLTNAEWQTPLPKDGRKVGVVVHHVASIYPLEIELAQKLAAGGAITDVTWDDVHALNAAHARDHDMVTKEETLALLRTNAGAAAAAIRAMSDKALDLVAPNSLYGNAPLTCQFMLEDHAVRHSFHHLALIRAALNRQATAAIAG
jgi:hypothetical protein